MIVKQRFLLEFVEIKKQDRVKRRTAGNPNHYQMCGADFRGILTLDKFTVKFEALVF